MIRNESRRSLARIAAGFVVPIAVSLCCAPPDGARAPEPVASSYTPGASIAHTVMCACTTCSPRSCCGGTTSENESTCLATDAGVACGAAVMSCTPRCMQLVWRVADTAPCESRRPTTCCGD